MKVSIDKAIERIRSGEVVAIPTETVYGLAADARNPLAIAKTFSLKGRPQDNPLIVHISRIEQLYDFADEIPEEALELAENYWPGPLTLVLRKKPEVLDAITAGLPTVALRMPDHPAAKKIIDACGPLTAPSANRSGRPSPTKPEHIMQDYDDTVAWVDGGETNIGLESTVLNLSEQPYAVLRPGKISADELSSFLGQKIETELNKSKLSPSPGTRYTHYKPNANVRWLKEGEKPGENPDALYLCHTMSFNDKSHTNVILFQEDYDLFAKTLYDLFRTADLKFFNEIIIEKIPETSILPILPALLNRIEKAISD